MFDDYIPGVVEDDHIIDISAAVGKTILEVAPELRMRAIISDFERLRDRIAEAVRAPGKPLNNVRLRAPVPQPSKMLFGLGNYRENVDGKLMPLAFFLKAPSSILDPGGTITLPSVDAIIFHHEAELGFVIGKKGKDISPDRAFDYVFGYTCIIDASARGLGSGVGFSDKSYDTFCPMGPWIVTKDEIPDPHNLSVRLWENDQLRQDYNTSDIEHPIPEMIASASSVSTLEVGDIFACGTNHQGIGPIQDGETSTIEIERIGRLTVRVEDPLKRRWPFEIDRGVGQAVRQAKLTGKFPPASEIFKTKRIS